MKKVCTRRLIAFLGVLTVFYGLLQSFGMEIDQYDAINWTFYSIAKLLCRAIGLGAIFFLILFIGLQYGNRLKAGYLPKRIRENRNTKKQIVFFLLCWAVFFLAFVPALLAYWPGIFAYDFTTQINQMDSGQMSTHHPILHTLICYILLNVQKRGSDCTIGALCYSCVQMLFLSGVFSYAVSFMYRRYVSRKWICVACLYFALLPIHALLAINATKDIFFAGMFLLCFLFTLEMAQDQELFFKSRWREIRYICTVVLMCLLRNTGIYVIFIMLIYAVAVLRQYRVKMLLIALICLFGYMFSAFSLAWVTGAESGSVVEALSVPIQQVARSYRDEPDSFTEEDKQTLFELIPEENLNNYSSRLADPVKNGVYWNASETITFLKLWLRKLPVCFGSYLNAFLCLTEGFWYPELNYPDARTYHYYIETGIKDINENYIITRSSKCTYAYTYYEMIAAGEGPENYPVLSLLFRPGTYAWILFCLIGIAWYQRKSCYAVPLCLLSAFWMITLLSPIALLRYAYPLMITIPVAIGFLLMPRNAQDFKEALNK